MDTSEQLLWTEKTALVKHVKKTSEMRERNMRSIFCCCDKE